MLVNFYFKNIKYRVKQEKKKQKEHWFQEISSQKHFLIIFS